MALGSMAYVPLLKARQAEIKAVLLAPNTLDVTPLFELQRAGAGVVDPTTGAAKRTKSTLTDASYFMDDVARLWDDPLYVDISRVAQPGQRLTWWKLLDSLNTLAPTAAELIPVLLPSDPTAVHVAAASVAAQTQRLALRISMTSAPAAAVLGGLTAAIAANTGIPVSAVDVILDWADVTEQFSLDDLEQTTAATITALSGQHGRLITIGTPNSVAFTQAGDWEVTRREWWLWLRLAHAGLDVTYGDYGLYPPSDPVPAGPRYGHLRYSSGDRMHVHRRATPPSGGGLGGAFGSCCKYLVNQAHWLGPGYSKADKRLNNIAADADKESAAGKWRQIALEHHLALVTEQLASPPPPPPAGTP